jgi:hypothetical protein
MSASPDARVQTIVVEQAGAMHTMADELIMLAATAHRVCSEANRREH